jgi:serine/threonine-protein kinase
MALWAQLADALAAQYELEREIGRGGMGIVYRARDRRLKRPVAIKLLPPELAFRSEIRTRFLREAETAAQLSHPNIVPIYTVGEQGGLVFFVMALVEGDTVASALSTRGPFASDAARRVLREVADALAYAHARGVVHRDIKPDNILLDGETGRAMVTDFGIARAMTGEDGASGGGGSASRLTATGIAIGTPAYMSPEQSAGERTIDGRSDLYSLGVVGYQMLCGEPPFKAGNTPALLMKHLTEAPVPIEHRRADIPADLSRAVMTLLAKEPEARFPSAGALAAALEPGAASGADAWPAAPGGSAGTAVGGRDSGTYATDGMPTGARRSGAWADTRRGTPSHGAEAVYKPSDEEVRRWHAAPVMRFRRRLAYYVSVNLVVILFALFSGFSLIGLTAVWSLFMAFQYATLWSDGFDWRDVFRQPRHREILDVASEAIDEAASLFDSKKRTELRERARRRMGTGERPVPLPGSTAPSPTPTTASMGRASMTGSVSLRGDPASLAVVRQAEMDRDEILRIIEGLSRAERQRIPEVAASANALVDRIRVLARTVAETAVDPATGTGDAMDEEIALLESQANPLDRAASEKRVRRLAFLKRQRRSVIDADQRRSQAAGRLEGCSVALQNMRLDVLRLSAGSQNHEHITSLAEQALVLAREVDSAMYVADEMARLSTRDPQQRLDRA